MTYNENNFLKAIEQSFSAYKEKGARSTARLKPIHKFVAETLGEIWGNDFEICYLGDETKEATVNGKYYPKDIDITVLENKSPFFVWE